VHLAAKVAIAIVALLHFYFLVLEMFLWTKPTGLKAFGLTPERAESSKVLAANQGLYNGFLGAGLLWSLTQGHHAFHLAMFFLVCVIIAGLYGAATANRKILYVQAFPGLVALVLIHLGFH
jgi:putative membrane protein